MDPKKALEVLYSMLFQNARMTGPEHNQANELYQSILAELTQLEVLRNKDGTSKNSSDAAGSSVDSGTSDVPMGTSGKSKRRV